MGCIIGSNLIHAALLLYSTSQLSYFTTIHTRQAASLLYRTRQAVLGRQYSAGSFTTIQYSTGSFTTIHYSAISTRQSVLGRQYSAGSTRQAVLGRQYSAGSTPHASFLPQLTSEWQLTATLWLPAPRHHQHLSIRRNYCLIYDLVIRMYLLLYLLSSSPCHIGCFIQFTDAGFCSSLLTFGFVNFKHVH